MKGSSVWICFYGPVDDISQASRMKAKGASLTEDEACWLGVKTFLADKPLRHRDVRLPHLGALQAAISAKNPKAALRAIEAMRLCVIKVREVQLASASPAEAERLFSES